MLVDERLGLRARDRVHVDGLQAIRDPHIARLVRLDDDVARSAFDGELEQVVKYLGMGGDRVHGGRLALLWIL